LVKNLGELPDKNKIKQLEKKLDRCRNQENNPDSDIYKQKMRKMLLEDEEDFINGSYHLVQNQSGDASMLNVSGNPANMTID
jgi:cyclin H